MFELFFWMFIIHLCVLIFSVIKEFRVLEIYSKIVASVMGTCCVFSLIKPTIDAPTALDVYRGKTTLEITYRDSVVVDSVVVYKMK